MRFAAIDIGSNAVRLLIEEVRLNNKKPELKKLNHIRIPLRLGMEVFETKKVSATKSKDFIDTMIAFKKLMKVYKVDHYMACATSAMREATNADHLVHIIKQESGIDVEVIHGDREAEIIYHTHAEDMIDDDFDHLYIDIGGGSCELSLFSNHKLINSHSFDIGTIRLLNNKVSKEQMQELKDWIKDIKRSTDYLAGVGTGGNINKLFTISGKKENKPLYPQEVKAIYDVLTKYSYDERVDVLGLKEDRADVIVPSTSLLLDIMKWSGMQCLYIPRVGLVDGIIRELYEQYYIL